MDRQSRLAAILKAVNENKEVIEQSIYGIELSLKTKEYARAKKCIDKILACELINSSLSEEARSLQEEIEAEKLEVLT